VTNKVLVKVEAKVAAAQIPTLQYIATLAIIKAIEDVIACDVTKDLGIRIKWPNDIYHEDIKLGGVLCKAIFHNGAFYVIVGIGLNLNNEEPTTCLNQILGITKEIRENHKDNTHNFDEKHPRVPTRPKKLTRELLIPKILEQFEILHTQLEKSGFAGVKEQYLCYWMHTNTQLAVLDTKGQTFVTVIGITDNGLLLAVDDRGVQYELHPDGNSLDLLQGLIRKKISKDLPGT
jgi:biotin--protein ligase